MPSASLLGREPRGRGRPSAGQAGSIEEHPTAVVVAAHVVSGEQLLRPHATGSDEKRTGEQGGGDSLPDYVHPYHRKTGAATRT
jgi:hypothetical protein